MPRIKSLLTTVEIGIVKKGHNCQGNATHRLQKGDRRMEVKNERSWDYYCLDCGVRILQRDAEKIKATLALITAGEVNSVEGAEPI
ncbi:hypothetical protein [Aquibium microcysteis]|uniref:hypothetical protein n=1 Tax=Aquibium microcysteis TaxID=675281 RepID=UPI00165D2404|nr:hypothetical protein [Aquibium microcysteis]